MATQGQYTYITLPLNEGLRITVPGREREWSRFLENIESIKKRSNGVLREHRGAAKNCRGAAKEGEEQRGSTGKYRGSKGEHKGN